MIHEKNLRKNGQRGKRKFRKWSYPRAKARENYGSEWPVVSNIKVKSAKTGKHPLDLSSRW